MIFLSSASSAAALVFYLPGVCTHTDTGGKQRRARVRNILKSSEKTQYSMNTLHILSCLFKYYILIYILWQKSKMNELLRNIHCGYFAHKDFCCFFANVNIEIPLIPLPPPPPPPVSHIFSLCF